MVMGIGTNTNPVVNARGDHQFKPAGATEAKLADQFTGMLDGIVAAGAELRNVANEMKVRNSQDRMMGTGGIDYRQMADAVSMGVMQTMSMLVQEAHRQGGGPGALAEALAGAGGGSTPPPVTPPPTPISTAAAFSPGGTAPTSSGGVERLPESGGEVVSNFEQYQSTRGMTVSGVRQSLGKMVSEYQPATQGRYEPLADDTAPGGFRWIDTENNVEVAADDPGVAKMMARANLVGATKGKVGSVLEATTVRAGVMNALPKGAGRALGVAGAVAQGGNYLLGKAIEQREANRAWQSQTGESNFSGFQQRAGGKVFEWGQRLQGIGAENAQAMYDGAASLGLRGADRTQALDFMSDQFRRTGMDVAKSLEMIQVAMENGNVGLVGLAGAIDQVTGAARDAGLNAEQMRESFRQTYAAVAGQFSAPGQAESFAAGLTSTKAGMGRSMQDVGMAGMLGETNMRRQAAMAGMSYSAYAASTATDATLRAAGTEAQVTQDARQALGAQGVQMIEEFVRTNSPTGLWADLTEAQKRQLAAEIVRISPDPQYLMVWASYAGFEANNPLDAAQALAETIAGGMNVTKRTAQSQGSSDIVSIKSGKGKEYATALAGAEGTSAGGSGSEMNSAAAYAGRVFSNRQDGDPTHKISPIVMRLLGKEEGSKFRNRTYKVQARDEKGKLVDKEVDLEQGLRNYAEQFEKGEAVILSGAGKGQTVAEAVGLSQAGNVKGGPGKDAGESYTAGKDYKADKGKDAGGTVTVQASPELRRFLNFIPSGAGVSVDSTPGATSIHNRPTGTG